MVWFSRLMQTKCRFRMNRLFAVVKCNFTRRNINMFGNHFHKHCNNEQLKTIKKIYLIIWCLLDVYFILNAILKCNFSSTWCFFFPLKKWKKSSYNRRMACLLLMRFSSCRLQCLRHFTNDKHNFNVPRLIIFPSSCLN